MEKVIGWVRFLIGIVLLVLGLWEVFGNNAVLTTSWVATLAGAYFVLGAIKHMKKGRK